MIKVDISTALFLYILFTTVSILIVWAFFNFGTKLKSFGSEEQHVWNCNICTITYIDSSSREISKCPRCGSYNDRINTAGSLFLEKRKELSI
ncbi:MAG: hypothetical protein ABH869_01220 [Candidatus Omnitrophota bacterium]